MTVNMIPIGVDRSISPLSTVTYDQTRPYHPFAHPTGDGEWLVQPPGSSHAIGGVRMRTDEDGQQEYVTYRIALSGETVTFDEIHPTLFHAVSWLRWRLGR